MPKKIGPIINYPYLMRIVASFSAKYSDRWGWWMVWARFMGRRRDAM
jgi:hypothetical protein